MLRALVDVMSTEDDLTGFNYMSSQMVEVTATLTAHETQIQILSDQLTVTRCQQAEETCGRMNVDALNHFIVIGGPLLPQGDDLQTKLKQQVIIIKIPCAKDMFLQKK